MILSTFDFTNFETYMDRIKEIQTNKSINGVNRNSYKLEIIHTNICSPYMDSHA